ncbi:hypothetical protein CYMTET_36469 [Cymbomonas tetramitiformis]|uniref:CSC1/OSCA1-like cytosolic domain-containing protein n=1 Tax=Cymbomonas tetramitiformis TaxID=36881 RepID=A0AAE0F7I7_9CHLO|nr:hypothetical protein CYMTET_36469 [Cymbomonas tetramitiformis]
MVVLSLINIYPLVNNIQQADFTERYYLSPSTSPSEKGVECVSSFASYSFITLSSLGALCASNRTNNAVTCPSICTVDLERTRLSDTIGITEVYERVYDDRDEDTIPVAYYWLIFVGTFIFLAWHLFLRHTQVLSASQINASTVTVGDFTVYVTGLGKNSNSRAELEDFFAHYGEVATAVYTKNLGDFLLLEKKLIELTVKEEELRLIDAHGTKYEGWWEWLWFKIYFRAVSGSLRGLTGAIDACKTEISEVRAKIELLQGRHLENTGEALVTFNYEAHANNVFRDHVQRDLKNRLTCKHGDAPLFLDKRISVYRAPEPSDVYWENMDIRGARLIVRRLVTHSSAVFILGTLVPCIPCCPSTPHSGVEPQKLGVDGLKEGGLS